MVRLGANRAKVLWAWKTLHVILSLTTLSLFLISQVLWFGADFFGPYDIRRSILEDLVFVILAAPFIIEIGIMWLHRSGLTVAHVLTGGMMTPPASRMFATIIALIILGGMAFGF